MSQVLDEIIDRLSPSTVNKLLQINRDSRYYSLSFMNCAKEAQQIKSSQMSKDVKRKTNELKLKIIDNKNYLAKVKNDLECMKLCKNLDENQQNIKAYLTKIKELEMQSKNLTRHVGGELDLRELFYNVESLSEEIEEYKRKISQVEKQFKCYNGFPPNVEQGKQLIAKIKQDIKNNEFIVEANLM